MLQIVFNKLTKDQKINLLINHILKILKKKNKSFDSCFILHLPVNGMISDVEFIRLLKKFLAKIQANQLYISVFEIEEKTQRLQVKILISAVYLGREIEVLRKLWSKFLLKENRLLLLNDVEGCFQFTSIIT